MLTRTSEAVTDPQMRIRLFSQAGVPWHDFATINVKAGVEDGLAEGQFQAVVSVFETPDRPDFFGDVDVIHRGAFADVIKVAEAGRPWPVVWTHAWDIPPMGPVSRASETKEGLQVLGTLALSDTGISGDYARSVHRAMRDGSLREFSFAFIPDEEAVEIEETGEGPFGPTFTRHIHRMAEVFEVGPTLVGRHPATRLIGVKSAASIPAPDKLRQVLTDDDREAMIERWAALYLNSNR